MRLKDRDWRFRLAWLQAHRRSVQFLGLQVVEVIAVFVRAHDVVGDLDAADVIREVAGDPQMSPPRPPRLGFL